MRGITDQWSLFYFRFNSHSILEDVRVIFTPISLYNIANIDTLIFPVIKDW